MSYKFVNGKIIERTLEEENLHTSEMETIVEDQEDSIQQQIEELQQMVAALLSK